MEKVATLEEYKGLVRGVKERAGKIDSNCILMSSAMEPYIREGRLFFRAFPEGLVLYADEGRYYELYYYWQPDAPFGEFMADKPVSAVEVISPGKREAYAVRMEEKLLSAGFSLFKTTLQLEADLTDLPYPLEEELSRRLEALKAQGITLRYCDDALLSQVRLLWETYLDPMDVPCGHLEESAEERILCAVDKSGKVAAVKWWRCVNRTQEGRHTVTDPAWYRHGLGTALLLAQFLYGREHGMTKNVTWVSDENVRSLAMCQKVGLVLNGRSSKQYTLS